jgi:hypothetical protein
MGATVRRVVPLVLGLVLAAGLAAAVIGHRGHRAPGQAYTVAEVRAGLAHQPGMWAGRTVLVHGIAIGSWWATGSSGTAGTLCAQPFPVGGRQFCPLVAPNGTTLYLTLDDDSIWLGRKRLFFALRQSNTPLLVLAVQPVAANPLIGLARQLPLLARFFPVLRRVPGGVSHLYRVRLGPTRTTPCTKPLCLCADGSLVDTQS